MIERLEQRCLLSAGIKGSVVVQIGSGNQPLAGITVFLDTDKDGALDGGELSVLSDAAGVYEFTNLAPGTYRVREVVPHDFELISFLPQVEVEDTFIGNGGTLINLHYWKVSGTAGADVITAQPDPAGAKVTVNGMPEVRDISMLSGISIRARAGSDRVTVDRGLQIRFRIFADSGKDTVIGGSGADSIMGGDGADSLRGGAGNDTIWGGGSDDRIFGDDGNDSVRGGMGVNYMRGGGGNDEMEGFSGIAGSGTSTVYGDGGDDTIFGSRGPDRIYGGDGDDYLDGWTGNDTLYGGAGNDQVDGVDRGQADTVRGGSGRDRGEMDKDDIFSGVETVFKSRW